MKRLNILLCISLLVASLLASCKDGDNDFSTRTDHKLAFSTDTLSFDTIFTTIGSATRQFMIYNKNKKPLNIQTIRLAGAGQSGFRINVDGMKGTSFQNVEIREKDSLFVFVEVTVDPTRKNNPVLIADSVLFLTNGNQQSVRLEAYGQDVTLLKGKTILDKDTLLPTERPYLVYDSLTIATGITVRMAKNTRFFMHNNAKLIINGTLVAQGTKEEPIVFRGDRMDELLEETPYDVLPAQWGGIHIGKDSYNNSLDHVIVRNGTTGITLEASDPERLKLQLSNTQLTNMDNNVLTATNCRIRASNCEFSNCGGHVVSLTGGTYRFDHCTLANHFRLGQRNGACLLLSGQSATDGQASVTYPLREATFNNCIIDGNYANKELRLDTDDPDNAGIETTFNYQFNHCLIKDKAHEDPAFVGTLWATESPAYQATGKDHYRYDYRPAKDSPVIGKADRSVAAKYPTDRYGIDRLADEGPDIGAYEWVPEKDDADKQ